MLLYFDRKSFFSFSREKIIAFDFRLLINVKNLATNGRVVFVNVDLNEGHGYDPSTGISIHRHNRRMWISREIPVNFTWKFSRELSSKSEIYVNFTLKSHEFHVKVWFTWNSRENNYLNFCKIDSVQERRIKIFVKNLSDVPSVLKMR